jgi:hypothetical protein
MSDAEAEFPDDANGDVLRRLLEDGDDLRKPRDVDFSVAFPNSRSAKAFARLAEAQGHRARLEGHEPRDVTIVRNMLPTHAGITAFEDELDRLATPLGGRNDGWGCFPQ